MAHVIFSCDQHTQNARVHTFLASNEIPYYLKICITSGKIISLNEKGCRNGPNKLWKTTVTRSAYAAKADNDT